MTLIELLVGMAVSSIVLLAVAAIFVGAQGAAKANTETKEAIESNREAISFLERKVRMAGYGLDPRFAFDFSGDKDDIVPAAPPMFQTDDLAFRYRDPAYLRRGSLDSGGSSLTLEGVGAMAQLGVELPAGQPMLLACSGAQAWWMAKTAAVAPSNLGQLNLVAYGGDFESNPPSCLRDATGDSAAYVFLVHEMRIRVAALGDRPFLVAYRGLGDPAANDDFDPIAENVEFFKVEYVMNRPQEGSNCCAALAPVDKAGGNWIIGDDADDTVLVPDPSAAAPDYEAAYYSAERFNAHPANIRQVRLTIGVRGEQTMKRGILTAGADGKPVFEGEEVAALPAGFYRTSARTTVRVPNLQSRSFFVPALKDPASSESLNVWGG